MAHELEIRHGAAQMFSVKETPWHRLGKIIAEAPTTKEGIKMAGLDWTVSQRPIFMATAAGEAQFLTNYRAITRDFDERVYNIMSDQYTPLQNSEAFEFFDPFIESGLATLETAGSLKMGANVWCLARLNKAPIEVGGGDEVYKYLLLSNAHDGTMAVRVGFTPIRVVCANTLAMTFGEESKMLRIFHGRSVKENLDKVQDVVNAANARFEATAEQYRFLASRSVSKKDLQKFVKIVFKQIETTDEQQRKSAANERIMQDITRLFETGRGANLKSANGTYWGLYNAASEYFNYERGDQEDIRLKSLWFGSSAKMNEHALDTAMKMSQQMAMVVA